METKTIVLLAVQVKSKSLNLYFVFSSLRATWKYFLKILLTLFCSLDDESQQKRKFQQLVQMILALANIIGPRRLAAPLSMVCPLIVVFLSIHSFRNDMAFLFCSVSALFQL